MRTHLSSWIILALLAGAPLSALLGQTGSGLVQAAVNFAKGKTYKLTPSPADLAAGNYDCTTFVQAVLRESGYDVGGAIGRQINIVLPDQDRARLKDLVEAKDARIKGVVTALVTSKQGREITSIKELQPGDVVQIWRIVGQNAGGHCGFIQSVDVKNSKVVLVSAHNPKDGVGAKEFDLGSKGWPIWFGVRPGK